MTDRKIEVHMTDGAILSPNMAYCATFDNFDGALDAGFQLQGFGKTPEEATANLLNQQAEYEAENEAENNYDESMDGDHDSAMTSVGWGTDEDYGGGDERF